MPTPEDLEAMKEHITLAEENLDKMRVELELARRAGIDVSAQENRYRELQEKIKRYKLVYKL